MISGGLFGAHSPANVENVIDEGQPAASDNPILQNEKPVLQLKSSGIQRPKNESSSLNISDDTFMLRDNVFANLTFNLRSGVIRLNVETMDHGYLYYCYFFKILAS